MPFFYLKINAFWFDPIFLFCITKKSDFFSLLLLNITSNPINYKIKMNDDKKFVFTYLL